MRIEIAAVGRMRRGAEADLVSLYLDRARKSGRALGLTEFHLSEIDESRAARAEDRRRQEAEKLRAGATAAGRRVVLDETGTLLDSRAFADQLSHWRDAGDAICRFLIGGPDGHADEMLQRADVVMALGRLTLPHLLARVVLAEQLYRVTTILSGHPYHRD